MRFFLLTLLLCASVHSTGQNKEELLKDLTVLSSKKFAGRGYVKHGLEKASDYIQKRLGQLGVSSQTQTYSFPVNTFPKKSNIIIDGRRLTEGKDFIINPRSGSFQGEMNVVYIDSSILMNGSLPNITNVIPVIDTRALDSPEEVNAQFDFIKSAIQKVPVVLLKEKLTWSVSQQSYSFPIIEVLWEPHIKQVKKISVKVEPTMIDFEAENVIAKIEGQRSDSLVVFTAHFDHIGKMGKALFPGASDNASGTAMTIDLARHYSNNKPEFDTYFIFFSGEEAGLRGSHHFVSYPTFDLDRVKFLINLDLMGSAADKITIVNGRLYEREMKLLASINSENKFVPKIKLRGKAANSDHYWFSESGVPAVFIYTEGNIKAYHDIYDTAEGVDWVNYEGVFTLLTEFVKRL